MANKSKSPKKRINSKKPKIPRRIHRAQKPAIKLHKKFIKQSMLIMYLGVAIIVFAMWFMYRSVDLAKISQETTVRDAAGMLAYDKTQIQTAKIVGSISQLKAEIKNYDWASTDLQLYMLDDYKDFKINCVVNGNLVGEVSYKLLKVEYDKYAVVLRGCNGEEKSILTKFSGHWANVFSGNTMVACSAVNDYGIPRIISNNCETNGVIYLNPNP